MILKLSTCYARYIALCFLYLFILGGSGVQASASNDTYYQISPASTVVENPGSKYSGTIDLPQQMTNEPQPAQQESKYLPTTVSEDDSLAKLLEQRDEIGGPSQPEMAGFKSVGSDNMVDLFSGDFSYNVPLLDVGGYPVNIFYNSGVTMDQEASWVGLGWNINPGAINRNMRGLPDDFNGRDSITKIQFIKPERTYGVNVGASVEGLGFDFLGLNLGVGVFYNTRRGIGLSASVSPSVGIGSHGGDSKTLALSFGWRLSGNSQSGGSQSFSINLAKNMKNDVSGSLSSSIGYHSRVGLQSLSLDAEVKKTNATEKKAHEAKTNADKGEFQILSVQNTYSSSIGFGYPATTPSINTKFYNQNFSLDVGLGGEAGGIFGNVKLGGYFTNRFIKKADISTTKPAFGMLYMQNGNDNREALLDFNRLNDGVYTPNSPTIAIPAYTYDVFSISGEGTGGAFRAYRGDIGYVNDPYMETGDVSGHLGIELGAGGYGKGGINAQLVLSPLSAGLWTGGNLAKETIKFRESQGTYQSVYFKNPGEKAIPDTAYQHTLGGEDLVRFQMINTGYGNPTVVPTLMRYTDTRQFKGDASNIKLGENNLTKQRDKRTQVITFLTADEASRVGFNRQIVSVNNLTDSTVQFGCDMQVNKIDRFNAVTDMVRKAHHISEIDVLGQDGRRYIYGIPVYNTKQIDVTFNKKGTSGSSTVTYESDDKTPDANPTKDGYVEKEIIPPYAHSFLLTALVSPNYVDVKGDGITEDDMGDAIKFNYGKVNKDFKWRTPVGINSASYNEGLKSDKNDDKAHYIYGEREMWYLYSIESKNMVARFYVKNDRSDSRAVLNEDGAPDTDFGAHRLDKISLFVKGDLLKYGAAAKPVKTVHFEYDYSLCTNVTGNTGNSGKLTLKRIYFTYNGNNKRIKNSYRFFYGSVNPSYDQKNVDRWGNYKPSTNNPLNNAARLSNADFPYVDDVRSNSDSYAKAWTLDSISLPSGGSVKVHFEADDYGFVQDRRAAGMFTIKGFGDTPTPASGMLINDRIYEGATKDYDYIYVSVPRAITASGTLNIRNQIQAYYLGNHAKTQQVFMKLSMVMPKGSNDMVPLYATIDDWGLVPGNDNKVIFIKVKRLESGYTPMVQYSLQFLKNFLPGLAYDGSDVSEEGGIKQIVKATAALGRSFTEAIRGGFKLLMDERKCRQAILNWSFIRLTDPNVKKAGGGLRVKKLVIHDNWNKLSASKRDTTDGMRSATYGQEYFYTKKEMVGKELTTISSGVASWEPGLGGEENPHREMMSFFNKNKLGPYDFGTVELPLAEMFFPSPSVGYSRVEVRSIHRDTVKNAPGIKVTEFYTNREFPYTSNYTPLEEHNATDEYKSPAILELLKIDIRKNVALSQGFKVDINDMNGRMKKEASYSPNNLIDPISYTENFYNIRKSSDQTYKFNHYFPVIEKPDGVISQNIIGRDIEMMTDFRQHIQKTVSVNLNFNLDVIMGVVVPIPLPTWFSPVSKEENCYRSSAVLKVVNHYAMVDSIIAVDKGSMVSTKNLVYDAETGNTLLTETNNEHNKPIYNFSYPAHWAYSGMGLAYKNIDTRYSGLTFRYGMLETPIDMSCFESGDEIYAFSQLNRGPAANWPCDNANGAYLPRNYASRIWAVYTGKAGSNNPRFVFMDAEGKPYTASDVSIRIIRSGKRNMLGDGLGAMTSLSSPIKTVSGKPTLVFETSTNVLQTTAAVFKDHWRVDEALFRVDSSYSTVQLARIKKLTVKMDSIVSVQKSMPHNLLGQPLSPSFSSQADDYVLAGRKKSAGIGPSVPLVSGRAYMLFNYSSLPSNVHIYKASLSLYSHTVQPNSTSTPIHGDQHSSTVSQTPGVVAYVNGLKGNWYSSTNSTGWSNYFTNSSNLSDHQMVLPASVTGNEHYELDNGIDSRIDVSEILRGNSSSTLGAQGKLGIQLKLRDDDVYPRWNDRINEYRCYWKSVQKTGKETSLQIYYYQCGDTTSVSNDNNDPHLNQLIKCGTTTADTFFCRSKFTKKTINPYVEGVWGNWRVDSAFVYYGVRKETDATVTNLDMRTAGAINNLQTFWNLNTASLLRNYSASDVWVWNSVITQYNRKGYDIENKDPLGRFNAGLYGYAQQLPTAVINNSRFRESMFDGFEDYDYHSTPCGESCQPVKHAVITNAKSNIDSTQRHTGKHSLRVGAYSYLQMNATIVDTASLERPYSIRVKVDSTLVTDTVVHSIGSGLSASFYNHSGFAQNSTIHCPGVTGTLVYTGVEQPKINWHNTASPAPRPGVQKQYYSARWSGKLVVERTASYVFKASSDNGFRIKLNGSYITNNTTTYGGSCGGYAQVSGTKQTSAVTLYRGDSYDIEIDMYNQWGDGSFSLLWSLDGGEFNEVPNRYFYNNSYGTINVTNPATYCVKLDTVQVRGNALTDVFSPIQGKRMLLSAWVKEGGNDCKCSTYVNNSITVSFTGSSQTYTFKASGSIIEGWQRYEHVFIIPSNATAIQVKMNNLAGNQVYFDDLRIHPFNGNMKSFVYNPSNLRLMAELDENNYASFYEYDDDGTLIRVKKETERGIKTITETRSALQKVQD